MFFRDSAYQTSSTDRPAAPENILTPAEAERILNETKYETAPETVKPRTKKTTATKKAVSRDLVLLCGGEKGTKAIKFRGN